MTIQIADYEFDGVFTDPAELPEYDIGVYIVVCMLEENPHCVLYVGTSEGGTGRSSGADVTETGNLQHTLQNHKKRDCWHDESHGEIGYYVKRVTDDDRRIAIRDELQWKYITPCGTDPWDTATGGDEDDLEHRFGPRGSESI
jgi:hypothetical protein